MDAQPKTLEQMSDDELEAEVRRLSSLNASVKFPAALVLHILQRIKIAKKQAYDEGREDGFEKASNQ